MRLLTASKYADRIALVILTAGFFMFRVIEMMAR